MKNNRRNRELRKTLMKIIFYCCMFFFLIASPLMAWDEPKDFRGLVFGENIETQIPKCSPEMINNSAPKNTDKYNTRCWIRLSAGGYEWYQLNGFGDFEGIELRSSADQIDGKLARISGFFPSSSFSRMVSILTERYGKPTVSEPDASGSRLPESSVQWLGENIHISLVMTSVQRNYSVFSYSTKIYRNAKSK